jgi:transmembrane sensor
MSPLERFGPIEERIRREASDWFARMRAPDADASRAEFNAWYATPDHAHAYEQLVGRWEQTAFIGASRTARDRRLTRASFAARHPGLSAAAAATALIGAITLAVTEWPTSKPEGAVVASTALRYETDLAIHDIALSDGSHVTLDKASLVLISYSTLRRSLILQRGRARFRAVHDPRRPFVVGAGMNEVTADGTVFDVALRGGATVVSPLEGSVTVRPRGAIAPARLILVNQQLVVPDGAPLPEPVAAAPETGTWLPRMITLDHTSLADAAAQVGQGARIQILFTDDSSALQITGTFKHGDTEALARAAQVMFNLKRGRDSSGNIILSRPLGGPPK